MYLASVCLVAQNTHYHQSCPCTRWVNIGRWAYWNCCCYCIVAFSLRISQCTFGQRESVVTVETQLTADYQCLPVECATSLKQIFRPSGDGVVEPLPEPAGREGRDRLRECEFDEQFHSANDLRDECNLNWMPKTKVLGMHRCTSPHLH